MSTGDGLRTICFENNAQLQTNGSERLHRHHLQVAVAPHNLSEEAYDCHWVAVDSLNGLRSPLGLANENANKHRYKQLLPRK